MPDSAQPTPGSALDQRDRFGWISISLHWITAIAVIALWYLGWSLDFIEAGAVDAQRRLHMSIGISAWVLIAVRIAWRLRSAHPRARGLGNVAHRLAKASHYLLLAALSVMLMSGPLMAWASGASIPVFDWFDVPGPVGESPVLQNLMHSLHVSSANVILVVTVIHVAAALKHLMFHEDESFVRMLWPGRSPPN